MPTPSPQLGIAAAMQAPMAPRTAGTTSRGAQTATALAPAAARAEVPSAIQQSIARIQEACQAPPLSPAEYRVLFEVIAKEMSENDLIGAQTLANITQRAQERGLELRRDDVRFVLEVVSEADPWFEQGASASLFAGRFRNFVVARCRGQGLQLSADEARPDRRLVRGRHLAARPAGRARQCSAASAAQERFGAGCRPARPDRPDTGAAEVAARAVGIVRIALVDAR